MLYLLTKTDMQMLERSHRFCLKLMQGLQCRTKTVIALGLLGMYSLESEVDSKKLILFGQLCNLNTGSRVKDVF